MSSSSIWWKSAVVYQVWPASFKDSNGDGIGDIRGLISKLDYLKDIGTDVIWLSPMFDSPQVDMGYDISDYQGVYPPYGTLEDMDDLIRGVHDRGMRLILDLVINHSSDQHAWFKESRSSKDNPKRDWYIWRPAAGFNDDGKPMPPTNWRANVGGSTWAWDQKTGEYYFHLFSDAQPDLNWDSPELRRAVYQSAVRFWLDKGIDGFRIDTCNLYSKDQTFQDAPVTNPQAEFQVAGEPYFANGPRMHEYMRELRQQMEPYDVMTVGELPHTKTLDKVLSYVHPDARQLDMVFLFDTVTLGHGKPAKLTGAPWDMDDFRASLARQQEVANLGGWSTSFLENHDQGRSISRFGSETSPELALRSGKALATLLISLTGTLFIYQGQEIGMRNIGPAWSLDEYKDELTQAHLHLIEQEIEALSLTGEAREERRRAAKEVILSIARDHSRTPMQWDDGPEAGFMDTGPEQEKMKPWMRTHDNYRDINVARQAGDPDSLLSFWKRAIRFRKRHFDVLGAGRFKPLVMSSSSSSSGWGAIVGFRKLSSSTSGSSSESDKRREAVIVINLSDQEGRFTYVPSTETGEGTDEKGFVKVFSNIYDDDNDTDRPRLTSGISSRLLPWEAVIYITE